MSRFLEDLLFGDDLALLSESPEGLKGKLVAWKGVLELKGLKLNDKNKY